MVRHIVLLKWNEEATSERLAALQSALAALPGQVEQIRAYSFGPNLGLVPGTADFGIVAEFDDSAGYLGYADHPAHLELIAEHVRPLIAERMAVQFSY